MPTANHCNVRFRRMCATTWLSHVAGFTMLLLTGCSNSESADHEFFMEKISCPSPAVDEFQPWGKSGIQHICKIKHGQFVAFENGYVHIRGQYENGKKVGLWFWYDASGNIVKTLDYSKTQTEK